MFHFCKTPSDKHQTLCQVVEHKLAKSALCLQVLLCYILQMSFLSWGHSSGPLQHYQQQLHRLLVVHTSLILFQQMVFFFDTVFRKSDLAVGFEFFHNPTGYVDIYSSCAERIHLNQLPLMYIQCKDANIAGHTLSMLKVSFIL